MAALTKASALGIVALAGAAAVYVAVAERSAKRFWEAALGMAVPALLVCAWWFLRNWRLYRDPLGLNAFVAVAGARHPVPTLGQLLAEWPGFVKSYWGLFGALNVPLPDWAYVALSVMGGIGLIGVPLAVWRMHRRGALGSARWTQWGLVLAWPVVVAVALLRWSTMTMGSQGRLMFSALSALSLLMATGLSAYVPRCRGRVLLASAAVLLIIAGLAPAHIIPPAYAQPAMLSEEEVLALSPRVDVTFGDGIIRLLSYHVDRDEAAPGDQVAVTFYWQCLQKMDADYSVFLHLLDENDVIVAQRDMYPGQGTYPTSLWSPGEVFADTFVLALPATTHTPVTGQFAVGFYQYGEGSRLRVTSGAGVVLGDMLRFGSLTIPRRVVNGVPNPMQVDLEDGVRLVGYDLDRTAARPGETVHLTLYWQAIRPVSQNYSVFTHILGEENRLWAQSDGWPQGGNAPTKTWPEGQVIPDPYELTLYPDAPAGVWEVEIGMYDERGTRLKVLDPAGHVAGDRVVLAHVRVLPPE